MAFKMKGFSGFQHSPVKQVQTGGTQIINGVLCDAEGIPIEDAEKKKWEANTVQNYKGPGTNNDSDKVDRGLGF